MASTRIAIPEESANRRVLRVVLSILLGIAVMWVVASAFGHVTRSEWVWWLAPLTVAFDGSLLLRAPLRGSGEPFTPAELHYLRDPGAPIHLISCIVATAVAAWGAYAGNRSAIIIGASFAILGRALEPDL
jgi:hypothetical protein